MLTTPGYLITALIGVMVLIGVIITCFVYWTYRMDQHHRRVLKAVAYAASRAQDDEARRIVADLHDELGPYLSSMKQQVSLLEEETGNIPQRVQQIREHLDKLYLGFKSVSMQLLPPVLIRKGPVFAINDFVHSLRLPPGLSVKIYPLECTELSFMQSMQVYRVLQEIVHNTIKHANARNFSIEAEFVDKELVIVTTDDGIGMKDLFEVESGGGGLGLHNIRMRCRNLNAKMELESMKGKGVQYTMKIPLYR